MRLSLRQNRLSVIKTVAKQIARLRIDTRLASMGINGLLPQNSSIALKSEVDQPTSFPVHWLDVRFTTDHN